MAENSKKSWRGFTEYLQYFDDERIFSGRILLLHIEGKLSFLSLTGPG